MSRPTPEIAERFWDAMRRSNSATQMAFWNEVPHAQRERIIAALDVAIAATGDAA